MMRSQLSLLLLAAFAAFAQTAPWPLGKISARTGLVLTDDAVVTLIQNSSGDVAHQYVSRIAQRPRVEGTPEYREAVEWVAGTAKELGLSEARVERYPADGVREYLGYRTKLAWTAKKAELWMVRPNRVRLTSYEDLAISLCRNSVSADVEADLVDIGAGLTDADYRTPVKGKLVLTSSEPGDVAGPAVEQRGALGIVSYWSIPNWDRLNRLPGDYPNLVGWRYLPEPAAGKKGTFAFMISARRARELQRMMETGEVVRLHAIVDAAPAPGTLDVATAAIRGAKYPDEEITLAAHLDEVGAEDNASGSASLLEVARTLTALVAAGKLPPPLRTIRFVWGPEYSGTAAWLAHHGGDTVKRIAAFNFDQLGADLLRAESVFQVTRTPDSTPSFLNAVTESALAFANRFNDVSYPRNKEFHIISVTGTRNRLQGRMVPYLAGSDHELYNHLGVPANFATMWPEKFYHSSEDTPDKVDPTQLHRAIVIGLAAIVPAAYADDGDAASLAALAAVWSHARLSEAESRGAARVLASDAAGLAGSARFARALMSHAYRTESEAVRSAAVFARTDGARQAVEGLASIVANERPATEEMIRWKAKALGTAAPEERLTAEERTAAHIFPARRAGHELTTSGAAFAKSPAPAVEEALREAVRKLADLGETDLRRMGFEDVPAFYANGKRSVLEICDDVEAEYGVRIDLASMMRYFEAFEKAGVMDLARK